MTRRVVPRVRLDLDDDASHSVQQEGRADQITCDGMDVPLEAPAGRGRRRTSRRQEAPSKSCG
jgi:hypothetical protein